MNFIGGFILFWLMAILTCVCWNIGLKLIAIWIGISIGACIIKIVKDKIGEIR